MNRNAHRADCASFGEQELLTPKEAALYLRVSKSYLDKLRVYGGGPRFLRLGKRKVLYRKSTLDTWLANQSFDSTSEYEELAPTAVEAPSNKKRYSTTNMPEHNKA